MVEVWPLLSVGKKSRKKNIPLMRSVNNSGPVRSHSVARKEKMESFWPKSWVTGGTKFRPGIPSNWRIFESYWLDIESQMDSILRVNLTRYWESNWLDIESQFDSILRVKLTRHWESSWLKFSLITRNSRSNFSSTSDSTSYVKMTPFSSLQQMRKNNNQCFQKQNNSNFYLFTLI